MKKLLQTLFVLLIIAIAYQSTNNTSAQVPEKFSYNAVIRDASGKLISEGTIGMKISILKGSATGDVVYTETKTPTTNKNGLISIEIGGGTGFSAINWADGIYFLKIETDPTGGTNYTISGTSQMLSVPYALHAKTANDILGGITETDPVFGASPAAGITGGDISNWDNAHSWGDHNGLYLDSDYAPNWTEITGKPNFADVAISGSYNDLKDKPVLFDGQYSSLEGTPDIPADIADLSDDDGLLFDGDYNSLDNLPVLNTDDWDEAHSWGDHSAEGYIILESDPFFTENFDFTGVTENDLLRFDGEKWMKFTPDFLTEYIEIQNLGDVLALGNDGNSVQIKNIADPTDDYDAATKAYVDLLETKVNALLAYYESFQNPPLVTTAAISAITDITALSGGIVLNNGGTDITARGVVWHTEELPTLDNNIGFTANQTGLGVFESELTGLTPETNYFVRAYATNTAGNGYGNQLQFSTLAAPPTTHTLNLNVSPASSGAVTGAGNYSEVAVVPITATPNEGYTFVNWTGDTDHIANTDASSTTVNMPAQNITLTANFVAEGGGGTVEDFDGNIYPTVIIGTQEWMAKNLRVTKYLNGDAIPTGLNNTDWGNTTNGAYAIYPHSELDGLNSDAEVLAAYGALYNWYAVDDSRGLCPVGWRVPTDEEWTTLTNYLGGEGVAGGKLKSTRTSPDAHPRWESPNTAATDDFGFSALPGGSRFSNGTFYFIGYFGYWWSATEYDASVAWFRIMNYYDSNVDRYYLGKELGFSVRCVRD
ncbi:MAG: fibrobacter succinogenes major paralogous domain-containing protein [Bacteroidetes bacterium]|nr:fibrobacter succinogenes major paralogous domain-containing protein [Bacteroidota bacterium]